MRPTFLAVLLLASTLAAALPAQGASRVEEQEYVMGISTCGLVGPTIARRCFHIEPGEVRLSVTLMEESATRDTGLPIIGRGQFLGIPSYNYAICGTREVNIPAGATGFLVDVQHGDRSGFCDDPSLAPVIHEYSPAIHGRITIAYR